MEQTIKHLTKNQQLDFWEDKFTELRIGKNKQHPVLSFPAEHHIPYVKNMIQSVKEGKRIPYKFRTKENAVLNRGKNK